MKQSEPTDYEFELITPTDYSCNLNLKIESKIMRLIFQKSMTTLRRKHNIKLGDSVDIKNKFDDVDEFSIDSKFHHMLKVLCRKTFSDVSAEIKNMKVEVLDNKILGANFKKVGEKWQIQIKLIGNCIDKR